MSLVMKGGYSSLRVLIALAARMRAQPVLNRDWLTAFSGLEADQKVIAAHGCYAMTATTALTAQNTLGVHDVHHTPPDFVKQQIDACIDDIGVDVIKIGRYTSQIKLHHVRKVC